MANSTIRMKHATETRVVYVDMTSKLISSELLTGTPVVVELITGDLTISSVGLSEAIQQVGAKDIGIDRAVVFTVSGGIAGVEYTLRATAVSDEGQTVIEWVRFRVI